MFKAKCPKTAPLQQQQMGHTFSGINHEGDFSLLKIQVLNSKSWPNISSTNTYLSALTPLMTYQDEESNHLSMPPKMFHNSAWSRGKSPVHVLFQNETGATVCSFAKVRAYLCFAHSRNFRITNRQLLRKCMADWQRFIFPYSHLSAVAVQGFKRQKFGWSWEIKDYHFVTIGVTRQVLSRPANISVAWHVWTQYLCNNTRFYQVKIRLKVGDWELPLCHNSYATI